MLDGSADTAQSSRIGYSLKDSDGIVVDSGTFIFTNYLMEKQLKKNKISTI